MDFDPYLPRDNYLKFYEFLGAIMLMGDTRFHTAHLHPCFIASTYNFQGDNYRNFHKLVECVMNLTMQE